MSGMTPERLAEIEDRLPDFIPLGAPEHDVLDLIDEVMRLRAGIETFIDNPTWHRGMYGSPFDMVRTDNLRALLNPSEQAGSAS